MVRVSVQNLVKVFPSPNGGEKRAVDGLSFQIGPGRIYGLLGPNGAGKTTTLRMVSGLMNPTSGSVTLNGFDVAVDPLAAKRSLGFLTANTGLYQRLTSRELLLYFAQLYGMRRAQAATRVDALIGQLGIGSFTDVRCGALSTGQRQRVNVARALIADPPIMVMDEPTLGLDVLSSRVILEYIRRERDAGKTIILSTHYLDEAEDLCDGIGLLHDGRLLAEGDIDALRRQSGEERLSNIFLKLIHADEKVEAIVP